jgi:hypothetical protein
MTDETYGTFEQAYEKAVQTMEAVKASPDTSGALVCTVRRTGDEDRPNHYGITVANFSDNDMGNLVDLLLNTLISNNTCGCKAHQALRTKLRMAQKVLNGQVVVVPMPYDMDDDDERHTKH